MRIFKSYKYPQLQVVIRGGRTPGDSIRFADGEYIPRERDVGLALLMHPGHGTMFHSEVILEHGLSYPRDVRVHYSNLNGILDSALPYFELTPYQYAQAVLLMTDIHKTDDVHNMKKDGKKVVVVQHGFRASRNYMAYSEHKPYSNKTLEQFRRPGRIFQEKKRIASMTANEFISDLFCAWSRQDKLDMVKNGVPRSKIVVVGCPVLGEKMPRITPETRRVLFVPRRGFVDVNDYENKIIYEKLRKIKDIELRVKPKNQEDARYYNQEHVVLSDRRLRTHIPMVDGLIEWLDVVIETKFSTFSMKAIHAGKEAIDMCYCVKPVRNLNRYIEESLKPGPQFVNKDSLYLYSRFSGWREGDPAENIYNAVKGLVNGKK